MVQLETVTEVDAVFFSIFGVPTNRSLQLSQSFLIYVLSKV